MVRMNCIFIFISSSDTKLLRKKSVKQKIKKQWPKVQDQVWYFTLMILCFQRDGHWQLEEQSDQGLHCLPFHLHPMDKFSMKRPLCLNFRVIIGQQTFRVSFRVDFYNIYCCQCKQESVVSTDVSVNKNHSLASF